MYVLCSPCILSPALRAKGITHPSDIALFAKSIGRCKKFGIEVVPLPCPETQYLGPDREPGTFLERLNTPEFATLLDELTGKVNDIVKERGPPLCILGVNSSPTCGVTSTYYGAENGRPPKREGRGVFYAKFRRSRHSMSQSSPSTGSTSPHRSSRKPSGRTMTQSLNCSRLIVSRFSSHRTSGDNHCGEEPRGTAEDFYPE